MTKIIIIGGVAGGASAAARARRLSEDAEIIMIERGDYVSFANCGLPYHISGAIKNRDSLLLQTPESFLNRFNVDVRIKQEVIDINPFEKTITVKKIDDSSKYQEHYDFLVLSPGASPVVPPISGIENPLTHTLRNMADMDAIKSIVEINQPKHVTVVGGGFIGLEMMEAFHQLNINTTLLELSEQVMTSIDREMAGLVHAEIINKGVDLRLNTGLSKVVYRDTNQLTLQLSNGDTVETELLVMAIGVRPDTTLARKAGIEIGQLGGIITQPNMLTSDPFIYAVGDVIEESDFVTGTPCIVPLAGPANRQGRMVADNIFGRNEHYQGTQGTAICKIFDLAAATTGKNENQLQKSGIFYEKVYVHTASHASYYPGAETISLKLLFAPDSGKILGAQAVGKDGVDKRIDLIAVAQRAGMTVKELQHVELSYAPPYGSAKDVINQAAFVANNVINGDVAPIHYDEINHLNSNQLLLDVRNPNELNNSGFIDGAINIPVDELRNRLNELPKDKEIIIYCQVGLRGHVAYRMLANHGYRAKNLLGGYRTWVYSKK